ncbi:CDP-alcohol phosphatidyltransferase family protein [Novosphingobium sp. NPDC080210]|uniref:CDP-alcohol phosphatidyltransferase family protein n=1 Tax=Novosphingobium sp. NPDC080210 TaxID=3390596 RepID=UPI003D0343A5
MALHDPQTARRESVPNPGPTAFRALILPDQTLPAPFAGRVAGITIAQRQRRQLLRLGAESVHEGENPRRGPVLLIEAGLIADERLLAAFLAEVQSRSWSRGPAMAVGPDGTPGGLAWLPAGLAAPDWAQIRREAEPVDLSGVDTYSPERRRRVPLLWQRPEDAASARKAASALLAAAQKGCLDWPARFVHPPIENAAVRLLWPTAVTPNMISVLAFLLGLYAAWCFATGALWTGLLIALAVGPIDGIDGKLARSRMEFSPWGDLEHVGDKIVEYAWFAGLAAALGTGTAWALAALIVCTALAEALLGEFYRRMTGAQLDDAGRFERNYRLVSGRRNTFFWSLLPFAWFDAWHAGLIAIAVYAAVNFFIMLWRFFVRLAEYGRVHSAAIARNLDATAYEKVFEDHGEQESGGEASPGPRAALPPAGSLGAP